MTSVDRVKAICKERKIPISKLEKELGFANGYIGQLRKGVLPDNRLRKIADYLGVTIDYLMTGEAPVEDEYYTNPETARMAQEMFEDPDMRSLFDMKRNMEPDKFKAHVNFMRELYRKEHPEDDGL